MKKQTKEPLKNKIIDAKCLIEYENINDRACFSANNVKSAVEWLKERLKESQENLITMIKSGEINDNEKDKSFAIIGTYSFCLKLIDIAFEDVIEK